MEQRDLLKDQIEQLGKVLAKILSDFLGLSSSGQFPTAMQTSTNQLKSELDLDLNKLLELKRSELKKYLTDRKLTAPHINTLSEYLEEIGRNKLPLNKEESIKHLRCALVLLELVDEITNTGSFERINRKSEIEKLIKVSE